MNTETRSYTRVVAAIALLVVLVAALVWQVHRREREILEIDPAERAAVVERTLENVRRLCLPAQGDGVVEWCGQQREWLALFPECGAECREVLARVGPRATR